MDDGVQGNAGDHRHHLADHEPVEQVAHRREPLLNGGRGKLAAELLDPGGDMDRCYAGKTCHSMTLGLGEEVAGRTGIGPAGVRVADRHREELEETQLRPLFCRGD